ncbi:MAG TPA: hypothetical protein VF092_03075 [Longimicrobium sp.]
MENFDRDPGLAGALRGAYGEVPEVDFDRLRGAVMAQAELPLARLRHERRRTLGGRFRALAPLAAAAGIAGAALALTVGSGPTHPREVSAADRQQVEQILDESVPDLGELVSGQSGGEEMLNAAIGS